MLHSMAKKKKKDIGFFNSRKEFQAWLNLGNQGGCSINETVLRNHCSTLESSCLPPRKQPSAGVGGGAVSLLWVCRSTNV